jgi:pimeloyl-ACP methyl ester carboxylesterase
MNAPPATPRRRSLLTRDGFRLSALEWEGPPPVPGRPEPAPLLCLPGISRTALDYMEVGARQSAHRRVVALDYLGHGESERPPSPTRYSVVEAVRDLLDAMAALHLHRVTLLGTSFGGILGMALAVFRPGTLGAVVLNDIGPTLGSGGLGHVREMIGRDPALPDLDAAADYLAERLPPLDLGERGWRGFAERTFALGEDGRWHPRWDIRIVHAMGADDGGVPLNLWPAFGALAHVPVMLVWGQESELLSESTVVAMRRARPDLHLVALPGVGHAPLLEAEAAREGLDRFLGERAP